MEENVQIRASFGSKLPKFGGSKPLGGFLRRPQNGAPPGLLEKANFGAEKHNEHVKTTALLSNWKKLKCQQNDQIAREPPNPTYEKKFPQSQVAADKNVRSLDGPIKSGKQTNMLSHKEDRNENILSNSTKLTKSTQNGRTPCSGLNLSKTQHNAFYANKPPLGLHRPRAHSVTGKTFSSNVFSTDSATFSHVRRSQSFSHTNSESLLQSAPLSRSHSFNREVEEIRPYQPQHVPIRTAFKQSPPTRTAKQYGLSSNNETLLKSNFTRAYCAASTPGLKKPGLPNGPPTFVPLGYKLSRPSLLKSNRSRFTREIIIDGTKRSSDSQFLDKTLLLSNGTCHEGEQSKEEGLGTDNSLFDDLEKQNRKDFLSYEDIDELSISSLSSSDKNDLSEDFSDDFIDLEDANKTVIALVSEKESPQKSLEYSVSELDDKNAINDSEWKAMNISVQNEAESDSPCYGENRISSAMDYRDPSSLELSPSDSSGGTYMWDEEGMEPIGTIHPCGSYDSSEMNSLDILNNLDSCDLEDDDLMLDVDLPEDTACDIGKSDNMTHYERSERNMRHPQQAFWKRTPPRLNGQEQYHLSKPDYHNGRTSYRESPTDHNAPSYYLQSPPSPQMMGLRDNTVMLDEMTLRHMVQDCTTVKTQLLKLKRLLQQEDDPELAVQEVQMSVPATPEPLETDTLWKTEDLLNEIQKLKEESKKKDETIKQLQQQLKTRCQCQTEKQEPKMEKPKQYDKYTQTTWRRSSVSNPQVLQCPNSIPSPTDHTSGKLIAHPPSEVQSKPQEQNQDPYSNYQHGHTRVTSKVPENELSDLLSTRLKINDAEGSLGDVKEMYDEGHGQLNVNKDVKPQDQSSDIHPYTHIPDTKKDHKPSYFVKATSTMPGQIPRPMTLQLPKPKTQNALVQRGFSSSISSNSCTNSKDPKMLAKTSNCLVQNECSTGQPSAHENSVAVNDKANPWCSTVSESQIPVTSPGCAKSARNLSLPVVKNKLPSAESPNQLQVAATDPVKPVSRIVPKGSMHRQPGNLTSKLKKPNSSKSDVLSSNVLSEAQKSLVKPTSSALPRPVSSNKKDNLHETVESSSPKRFSRLPQPKAH